MDDLKDRIYLGDGVYAGHDGYQVWVYTQEGNRIALEPPVLEALIAYDKRHALLLLDQAAAPAFMVVPHVVSGTQNDGLPPREYTAEEMEKLKPSSISGNNR